MISRTRSSRSSDALSNRGKRGQWQSRERKVPEAKPTQQASQRGAGLQPGTVNPGVVLVGAGQEAVWRQRLNESATAGEVRAEIGAQRHPGFVSLNMDKRRTASPQARKPFRSGKRRERTAVNHIVARPENPDRNVCALLRPQKRVQHVLIAPTMDGPIGKGSDLPLPVVRIAQQLVPSFQQG